ncbi:filamentous hemagglutinin N-terminal domain-containing protein [Variovorax gossypii]|uniref:Filamentous hemagglutinin N-terminal domain-containing protein n=2 Tax=Variovorax gossypii TaxID=1679495 RepID=A0A3S0II07_9BURK|nr:filamentous hemagglutinin N-terminal domain-containing protein [Variovorax gossypii]
MKRHEGHNSRSRKPDAVVHQRSFRSFRISPLAQAMALALAAGATTTIALPAHAQQALGAAWMAQKNMAQNTASATGRLPNGIPASMLTSPQAQQQRANVQLQQSINNLNLTARGIAAQQAAQAAARAAAQNDASVPDGLADGGLRVDTNSLTAGWANANAPVQTRQADGHTNVAIQQTGDRAILNWETFNVGRNTTVKFDQQADWAVLNRVNDPKARPSQIQGQIQADGTVLIANRNGIVFSGTSQVDTRNLVAAAAHISDSQFKANGIYSAGTTPSFTDAQGKVEVQAGARIATRAPTVSTDGGGYVLLVGQEVHNAGDIATPRGQAVLAAGDSFIIKKGSGTGGNQASTTRGNEVTPQFITDSLAGKVSNTGLIVAREGDVTMVGRDVRQDGVALATTTVNTRGTVHLAAVGADGKVALGQGATTAVVIEDDGKTTALDSQRDGLRGPALVTGNQDIVAVADRRDQSRIEIASSGTVDFQADSLTLATGGQIAVTAAARTLVRDRAQIDVSGAVGVNLAMESNNVKINVQGNEQRDAPLNRDGKRLNNNDVWIDRRSLVFVPKGTNGYASERWYTAGGLLEVGGYLGTEGHTASEWMAQGGTVTFGGAEVVTQGGSSINLSGGTLNVQTGFIRQTWLKGADGRLYEVSKAPGDQRYEGLYRGFEDEHKRWGAKNTGYFYNPLIGPQRRLENGYTVGRDAGKLVVATGAAVLEGGITAEAFQGTRQTQAPKAGLDGYDQSHDAASRRGQLIVGEYLPMFDRRTGALDHLLNATMDRVEFKETGDTGERIAAALDLATALPAERRNSLLLDTAQLNGLSLGAVRIAARNRIEVNADLQTAAGGNITLYGNDVAVKADLTAHGGSIVLGNVLAQPGPSGTLDTFVNAKEPRGHVTLAEGARLDASGLWRNAELDPSTQDLAYANGGSVSIRGTGNVALQRASVIDVSSGAIMRTGGKTQAGKGGSVTLATTTRAGSLRLDPEAQLRGHGVAGGGTLAIQAGKVLVSDQPASAEAADSGTLVLGGGFFDKGFSAYEITGSEGLTVAEGTQVDVTMPVYRFRDDARRVASDAGTARALELWTPPLYQEDAVNAVLQQRKGASLSLQAGRSLLTEIDPATSTLTIGRGARLEVDPGQAIALRGAGQITIDGTLNAHGGSIDVRQQQYGFVDVAGLTPEADGKVHTRSIWIGDNAVLDVSGRAHTATDVHGRTYGRVERGGSIVLGGTIDHDRAVASSADAYLIVRPGAKLDASGAQAVLDVPGLGSTTVATDGGRISLSSYLGLHIDGSLRAAAGGAGAAGGSLDIALESPLYDSGGLDRAQQEAIVPRELTVAQSQSRASLLPDDLAPGQADAALRYGKTRLSADRLGAGGFDNLTLLANGQLSFDGDVSLRMGQGLTLFSSSLSLAESSGASARVQLAAPYVKLSGTGAYYAAVGVLRPRMLHGMTPLDSRAEFSVQAGRLLDLGNSISFGTEGSYAMQSEFTPVHVERRGFGKVELASDGDIRFLLANDNDSRSRLWTHGGLTFSAAQLYPETGAIASVNAGYRMDPVALRVVYDPDSVLRIERRGDTPAGVPYSAFGALEFGAAVIEQAGVVRAPLGSIRLGTDLKQGALNVALLPGSITSVSGAGLTMPYGGTTDGIDYRYDGRSVQPVGAGGGAGIRLGAEHVDVQAGAVLDLSGGGELTGAGFIAGRGGSTDARFHPLMQIGADGRFSLPSLSTNAVYAIVPGAQPLAAPASGPAGASQAAVGRQITIGAGVPGLPAGTYTLMPSTYALLPGAFRVELNGAAGSVGTTGQALAMRNGSWAATGRLSVAGTGQRDSLPSQVIVTPADVLRTYAQYNETSYADFVRADAARLGVPRGVLPADAGSLAFVLGSGRGGMSLEFDGLARFQAAQGGRGGTAMVLGGDLEVLGSEQSRTAGFEGASVHADTLNDLHADRLVVGARPTVIYGQQGRYVGFNEAMSNVKLRAGAVLKAPEVFLAGRGNLVVEAGAGISTLGQGAPIYDSSSGFVYQPGDSSLLAVSNGRLDVLAPAATGKGSILLGVCNTSSCSANSTFYSEGTITAATNGAFELSEASRYGTRHLALAVGGVNAGSVPALADAQARGVLASGLTLNQDVLQRLLNGDTSTGAPALESLTLTARDAINFYGSLTLDTIDPATGRSRLDTLVLGTPAIYGSGSAGDVATIRTRNLVWSGATQAPGSVASGGAGTGGGTLDIQAERIELGDMPHTVSNGQDDNARLALGFATVKLGASDRLTSSRRGSLSVYQSQGAYEDGKGYAYSGGNLEIATPLVTGEAGAVNRITAGGSLRIGASGGNRYDAAAGKAIQTLGADLALSARDIVLDTAIVLPTGKLTLTAKDDVTLADGALIDVGGRKLGFNDLDKFSWGGDVGLESQAGSIRQAAGATIDLSAQGNRAGTLKAVALGSAAGVVDLQGRILGASSGHYDAGGTMVPFKAGSVDVRAQRLGDSGTLDDQFAGLNRRLNDGAVYGSRSFQLKQGDLVIGNGLKAGEVNVSVDNGSLTVLGTIDASGERVGSIRLAGKNGLTIGGGALLDAHGTVLRVDSRGKIIDAPNRAIVELNGGDGVLTLAGGARIDLRHGTDATVGNQPGQHDGQKRGTLELNAARTGETSGDIKIDASGSLNIEGARSIALNAVWRYDDTDPLAVIKDGLDSVSGRPYREITQAYLDQKHAQSTKFIDAALANGALLHGKLAGLNNATYADALHLRPGVEIVTDKDLVVQGDLDLSGYRYASLNPRTQKTGVYGSGEAGSLVLRAAGNMDIYGSINDGFAPPPLTPDENGWALVPGVQPYNGDLVLPIGGVRLAEGTAFPSGATLNYDLPIQELTLGAAVRLPAAATLAKPLTLTAGTVLAADVRDAAGNLLHARGTLLKDAVTLAAGTQLGAGTPLPSGTALRAMLWPKGVPLPVAYENDVVRNTVLLRGALDLGRGALIPSATRVVLENGVGYIELRPGSDGTRGRNWALAPMLPAGSESWAVRLVAGADLGAADTRIALANTGSLRLADTHYGATVTKGGGTLVWAENNNWGMPAGQPVTKEEEALCPLLDPGDCITKTGIVWAPGNVFGEPAGTTVPDEYLVLCDIIAGSCIDYGSAVNVIAAHGQGISVVRTGTGDLDLIASGDIDARSLYGIYTAGTQSAGVDGRFNRARGNAPGTTSVLGAGGSDYESLVAGDGRIYQAWFPEAGGNLTVRAGGDLTSDMLSTSANDAAQKASVGVGNWLWRQGDGSAQLPTAWWINFGSYAVDPAGLLAADVKPSLVGFTGFGALGGGNVQVQAGGNAGMLERKGTARSQGLVVAVGSTGRVADDGSIVLTGGGDIDMRIGGGVNSSQLARGNANTTFVPNHDLQGALVNLRGATQLSAASLGGMILGGRDLKDPRAFDPFSSNRAESTGGLVLVPGDSAMRIDTMGDLVVGAAADAGRVRMQNSSPFSTGSGTYGGGGLSWFSLWTDRTAIDLFSAGGSLTPSTQMSESTLQSLTTSVNASASDYRFVYPAILRAVAAGGSIYNGAAANAASDGVNEYASRTSLLLAPSRSGQLELLAGDSLYMGSYPINQSGADPAAMPSPLKPAFTGFSGNTRVASNIGTEGLTMTARTDPFRLFAFAPETYAATDALRTPSRFYAMTGDIVGLRSGEIVAREDGRTWYEAAAPSWVMAGRDIVSAGTVLGQPALTSLGGTSATSSGNLAIHGHAQDVSRVVAGRDILYSSFNVAGPGTLEVSAGRNIVMEDRAAIASLGPLTAGDKRLGASIAMMAGTGAQGADYSGFLARYLGAANRALAGTSLASQPGKVVKTYEAELLAWLSDKDNGLGFSGTADEALAFFDALPAEQQRVFARQVYFAELKASGREYNDAGSARSGSYLRGRNAIAALFPESDAAGGAISYRGDITMYGPAGVNTLFGGGIQMFTPGGAQVFGIEGDAPVARGGITPGVITQGKGDISTYSLGSILLGQSRIMTTFGGHIMGWSAEGDINAGRGSKTTVVYTPPKREYDQWGNVTLSSNVPSTGAGIATLAPIPEVPAGDIDLIAPLGTIDAGEAGIRVSGNVNLAALQVVNAANIAVKGESAGIPTLAAVNVGALTNASAAASQAAGAAQEVLQRERAAQRQALPSVFTVRVLGFGDEPAAGAPGTGEVRRKPAEQTSYDPSSFIQMVGHGALTDAQITRLSESERRGLPRGR